ncbi:MAG: hypothetical protein ACT4PP_15145 [Sporichthyaceae bacterium]
MAYSVPDSQLLMGWVNARTAERRQWRCFSLRHMLLDERAGGAHDPFSDVLAFLRCADRIVGYGFPRAATKPGYRQHILQYHGTKRRGHVIFDEANGDIITIYTDPNNDWRECATWTP